MSPLGYMDFEATILSCELFDGPPDRGQRDRGKAYSALGVPLLCFCSNGAGWSDEICIRPYSYYTQIEMAAGLGGTLRLGVNPGEFVDFLLGWTTLDIFDDDPGRRKKEEET